MKLGVFGAGSINALAGVPLREQLADRGYRLVMAGVVRAGSAKNTAFPPH